MDLVPKPTTSLPTDAFITPLVEAPDSQRLPQYHPQGGSRHSLSAIGMTLAVPPAILVRFPFRFVTLQLLKSTLVGNCSAQHPYRAPSQCTLRMSSTAASLQRPPFSLPSFRADLLPTDAKTKTAEPNGKPKWKTIYDAWANSLVGGALTERG